jgi:hypothetical protein
MFGKKIVGSANGWPQGRLLGLGSLFLVLLALGSGCSNWQWGRSAGAYSGLEVRPATGDTARLLHNAYYLSLMGRKDLALKELEEAFQVEPQNLRVANALAQGYEEVGAYDKAQQVYQKALSRDEGNSALRNNLCYSYYLEGKFQKAEACLRQALERNPKHVAARNNLGLLLCRTNRQEEARLLWQEAEGPVAAEKKLKEVLAFLGTGGSVTYASQSPPAGAPTAARAGSGSAAAGKARPMAAKPKAKAAPMVASAPQGVRHRAIKAAETSGPDRYRDKPMSAATTKIASATPTVNPRKLMVPEAPSQAQAKAAPVKGWPKGDSRKPVAAKGPKERERPLTAQELMGTNIRVENGNGFHHLARDTRHFLSQEGFNVVAIKNYIDFGVEDTVIYYRPEAAKLAKVLAEKFFHTTKVQVKDKLPGGIDVRVIMGHDLLLKEDLLAKLAG